MPSSWRPRTPSGSRTPCEILNEPVGDDWLALLDAARGETGWRQLLVEAGGLGALLGASDRRLTEAGLRSAAIERLRKPNAATLAGWRAWLERPGRALIPLGAPAYPPQLAATPHPPLALWVQGARPELLAGPQVAVVGSRNATAGGKRTAEDFGRFLGRSGLTVTSGLATGIDEASHRGALGTAGGTVAVLGCGIDTVFPRENRALARAIAAEGLLVSEYPPGVPPRAPQFPARNRIIAGLALGTLVVEAGRRSGALITAARARDYGREVFAIPGSIHNPLARGCHGLIKQGAKLVEEGADLLVELAGLIELPDAATEALAEGEARGAGAEASPLAVPGSAGADPAYAALLEALGYAPAAMGELVERSGLTAGEVSSMLLILELEGFVEALPGGRYSRLPARSR